MRSTTHISRALARRAPSRDGVVGFAGVVLGAVLGALCWLVAGLVVWVALR